MNKTGKVIIHGNEYATVALRIQEFRKVHPKWEISTEIVEVNDQKVIMQARIYSDEQKCVATAHAEEKRDSSPINKTSCLLNCETSAVGRALSFAGFGGSDFIASAEEMVSALTKEVSPEVEKLKKELSGCGNLKELQDAWKKLTESQRKSLAGFKDELKASLK